MYAFKSNLQGDVVAKKSPFLVIFSPIYKFQLIFSETPMKLIFYISMPTLWGYSEEL